LGADVFASKRLLDQFARTLAISMLTFQEN
jgi:hypothetical protein